jgi:hypothetical protein
MNQNTTNNKEKQTLIEIEEEKWKETKRDCAVEEYIV